MSDNVVTPVAFDFNKPGMQVVGKPITFNGEVFNLTAVREVSSNVSSAGVVQSVSHRFELHKGDIVSPAIHSFDIADPGAGVDYNTYYKGMIDNFNNWLKATYAPEVKVIPPPLDSPAWVAALTTLITETNLVLDSKGGYPQVALTLV
jgi:hypothetical protein